MYAHTCARRGRVCVCVWMRSFRLAPARFHVSLLFPLVNETHRRGEEGVEMEEMEEGDHPRGNGGNEADEGEANRPEGWSERKIGTKDGGGAKLFRAPWNKRIERETKARVGLWESVWEGFSVFLFLCLSLLLTRPLYVRVIIPRKNLEEVVGVAERLAGVIVHCQGLMLAIDDGFL